jgi:hypothetical protein
MFTFDLMIFQKREFSQRLIKDLIRDREFETSGLEKLLFTHG